MIVAKAPEARSRSYTSPTIARPSTIPAQPPSAWSVRPMISAGSDQASPHSTLPAKNSASPAISTGRRPKRSETGPYTSCPAAIPARNRVSTSWTAPGAASKTAASNGSAGTSICKAAGAIAVTRAKRASGGPRRSARPPARAIGMVRGGRSERDRAAHHAAVQDAPVLARLVIGNGPMQQTAVVPHHEIAPAPTVGVDESPLGRVLQQLIEEGGSLRLGHAEDVRGVVAEIERLVTGIRMSTDERVIDRRTVTHSSDRLTAARSPAKDHAQSGDAALGFLRQRRIARHGVRELGVAALGRQLDPVKHRQRRRHRVVGLVGVPAVVADRRGRPVDRIAVLVEVGDHMGDLVALATRLARRLDLAEIPREGVLLLPGQHLAGEDDDVVVEKRLQDLCFQLGRQGLRKIDAGNRDATRRRQARPHNKLHLRSLAGRRPFGRWFKNPYSGR